MSRTERSVSESRTIRHVPTRVHGRYLLELAAAEAPDGLVVGFHGYGEDAAAHLEQLRCIPGVERWHRAAVQALHPFYTRSGEVVACWMTKQDRELAIEDNVRYVGSVIEALERELGEPARRVFAGFSQGVAMTWRAAARSGHPCHGVIALAGDVPPEVGEVGPLPAGLPALLGRGVEDSWYTEEKMNADLEILARRGVEVETCVFEDGHVWAEDFLSAAGRFLVRVRSAS
jgi:predicted esterase